MASQSSGKPPVQREQGGVGHGDSDSSAAGHQASPLTYGKVFGVIPRVTGVNTPNINERIAKKWGLPEVASSSEFRKVYTEGRATLRYSQDDKIFPLFFI